MDPSDARTRLLTRLADRGLALDRLDAPAATDLMLRFYTEERADHIVHLDEDGDMLVFEWGVYDFDGDGPSFQLSLTRQLMLAPEDEDDEEDEAITQLRLTLHYEATPAAGELGSGHRWCHRIDQVDAFRAFIATSDAVALVGEHPPARVSLEYETV